MSPTGDIYWARLVLQEIIQTFLFTLAYLVLTFEPTLVKLDRVVKGFCLSFVLTACFEMNLGSKALMNPAMGFAQSTYMVALDNRNGSTLGSDEAQYMWVYILMPFVGAAIAVLLF